MSDINPEILLSEQYPSRHVSTIETLSSPFEPLTPMTQQPTLLFQQGEQQNNDKVEQEDNEKKDYYEQDGVPLTAAGLTRAMETNQGQPLTEIINISTANTSHLFWVPASQHPELAPAEFEKYVTALRTTAIDKGKVRRRRSVLSVSFTAGEDGEILIATTGDNELKTSDSQEEDSDSNCESGRQSALDALENRQKTPISLIRSNSMKSLGEMNDIDQHIFDQSMKQQNSNTQDQDKDKDQHNKLEVKARKDKLRRSMSLQLLGNNTDPGRIPDFLVFDRNSTTLDQSPVLVPRTNRPLSRRGARTKFQRTSSISASTMKLANHSPPEKRWPTYRHSDSIYTSLSPTTDSKKDILKDNDENMMGLDSEGQPYQHHNLSDSALLFNEPDIDLDLTLSASTTMKSLQPSTISNQPLNAHDSLNAEKLEDLSVKNAYSALPDHPMTTSIQSTTSLSSPSPPPPSDQLESSQAPPFTKSPPRERKSSWSWSFWSDDKKTKNEQPSMLSSTPTTNHETSQESNDSKLDSTPPQPTTSTSTPTSKQRFGFSSLFSRKNSITNNSTMTSTSSDANKKATATTNDECLANMPLIPPKDFQLNKINHQRRLPIHVERAVYRLSHLKLANPRRPLHEQVIISNFMFWYLTIISQHQKTSENQASPSSIPSQHDSSTSRRAPPRTPQQIVAASKKKKKRLTKKTSQQNQHPQNGMNKVPAQQRQYHPSSPTLSTSPVPSNQRNQSLSASATTNQIQDKSSWQHYVDGSSKQSSTGFVIPENYLRPPSESNLNDSDTHSDHTKNPPRQRRQYVRRNSSSSEDDDDDDDDDDENDDDEDEDEEEDDEDDGYVNPKIKGNKSQYRAKTNHAFNKQQQQQQQQHYKMSSAPPSTPILSSRHNSIPLAMHKKAAIS